MNKKIKKNNPASSVKKALSVCIPTYDMDGLGQSFLKHSLDILTKQTFTDFDVIITDNSENNLIKKLSEEYKNSLDIKYYKNERNIGMTANVNRSIKSATGKIIKILFQDDFLFDEKSLENIINNFDLKKDNWLVTACEHSKNGTNFYRPFYPKYNNKIHFGNNTISAPSVLTIKNENPLLFDENLIWFMDCDYYKRCHDKFGNPKIINKISVVIRTGKHQISNTSINKEIIDKERKYIIKKIVKNIIYKLYIPIKKKLQSARLNSPSNIMWRIKFGYIKENKMINIIWRKIDTTGSIIAPIDMLYAKIFSPTGFKIVSLNETPHYHWIKDIIENTDDTLSRAKYYEYVKTFFPEENTDHQLNKIKKMALSFIIDNCDIVIYIPIRDKNYNYKLVLYDGVHRASIMRALKYKKVKCRIVK